MKRLLLSLFILVFTTGAYALSDSVDKVESSVIDTSKVYDLDEIVVLSRPKEIFRLRQQSISSSAFFNSDISSLSANDVREMANFVPSFSMPNYGSRITSSMYIRGIGSRINNPAVAMYVDNMPLLSKSAFNIHTYALSSFEVLRGPQGTLYGQNSEGGLVRMYTINPFYYQGTDITLGGGSYGYRKVEASHYNMFSENFAYSLDAFYNGQNGFYRNVTLNKQADNYDETGGRMRLGFRPSKKWNFCLMTDYQYVRQNGFPYGLYDIEESKTESPSANRKGYYKRNLLNSVLDVTYHSDDIDINSTTSYQYINDYMTMDVDYLPQDYMHLNQKQLQNGITQEFSIKRRNENVWNWTGGLFTSYQWMKTDAPVFFDNDFNNFLATSIEKGMKEAMIASMMGRNMTREQAEAMIEHMGVKVNNVVMSPVNGLFHTPQLNIGVYHQSDINITSRLCATIGLRFSYDKVRLEYKTDASMSLNATVSHVNACHTLSSLLEDKVNGNYRQLLPKFALNYKLNDNKSNIYLSLSKGYRAGGYNIQMFSDILQAELNNNSSKASSGDYEVSHTEADYDIVKKTISYKPETSWNYETGAHVSLFNERVKWDIAAFYMQVHNQQLSVMAGNYGFGRRMVNAGKSSSCGLETSFRGNVFDNKLSWLLSYGFTHATFRNYSDSISVGGRNQFVDYKGKFIPYVPQHTLSAMVDYCINLPAGLIKKIMAGANVTVQGKTYWDEANSYSQNMYAVVGAHINFDLGCVSLNIWGKNLTDSKYNTFAVGSGATGKQLYFAQQGNPFRIGADMKIHF